MVDTTKELRVESDASDFATGAVLSSWLHVIIGGLVLLYRSRTMYRDVTIVKE